MNVTIHKQIDHFEKIFPEWRVLKEEFHELTVFQDINWLKSWWEYKSKHGDITPYIVEIRKEDHIIGIIPLYISKIGFKGIEFRVLKPFGSKDSDYLLPILSKKYSPTQLLSLAFNKIYEDKLSWDFIEWADVPEDSFFAHFLNKQLARESRLIIRNKTVVCPILHLNGDEEEVKRKLSKKLLKEIMAKQRKINKEGELNFSKVGKEEEIEPILNNFFELHCGRWKNTETPSIFSSNEEREYALRLAKSLFKSNLLYLVYLKYDNEIIGVNFAMADGKRRYLYLHAINMNYYKFSPGNLLTYHVIMDSCREGYEVVDFLRGEENYKKDWGTVERFNFKYFLFNRTFKSLALKKGYEITASNLQLKKIMKRMAGSV